MRLLNVFLLTMLFNSVVAHEGHQAFYDISVENGKMILLAKLEIPDLEKSLKSEGVCVDGQDFNFCAGNWLMDQIALSIDEKIRSLNLEESYTEDGHLFLKYTLGAPPSEESTLEMSNTAFIKQFPDYENIVQSTLDDNKQGYKMDKDRTTITIKLNQ